MESELLPALIYPSGWHWQFPNPEMGELLLFTPDTTFQQVVHAALAVLAPDGWWDWTHLWWMQLGDGDRVACEYFIDEDDWMLDDAAEIGYDIIDPDTPLCTLGRKKRIDLIWDMGNSLYCTVKFGKRQRPYLGPSGVAAPFTDPEWSHRYSYLERNIAGRSWRNP